MSTCWRYFSIAEREGRYIVKKATIVLLILFLGGVFIDPSAKAGNDGPGLSGAREFKEIVVMWRVWKNGDQLSVTGGIRAIGPKPVRNLELRARHISATGEELGRATFAFFPTTIEPGTFLHQGLSLPVPPGKKPASIELVYVYYHEDDEEEVLPTFEGFKVDLSELK